MNKGLFFSFIHPKVFNFLSGAENKVTITVFLSRKKSKSSKTGRLIEGRCVQVSLCCIKLFDENALSLNFFTFFGRREGDSYSLLWAHFLESLLFSPAALEGFVVLHKSTLFMSSTRTMLDGSWRFIR